MPFKSFRERVKKEFLQDNEQLFFYKGQFYEMVTCSSTINFMFFFLFLPRWLCKCVYNFHCACNVHVRVVYLRM